MLDVMPSGDDSRTDRHVDHESMALELNSVLNKVLKDREITIIRECFGIGCHEKGLEEIGDQLDLHVSVYARSERRALPSCATAATPRF